MLTVDLPIDELGELAEPLAPRNGIGVVPLVAPTSTPERIARVGAAFSPPFVYYISLVGVTGAGVAQRPWTLRASI